jgi:hypothetical protein
MLLLLLLLGRHRHSTLLSSYAHVQTDARPVAHILACYYFSLLKQAGDYFSKLACYYFSVLNQAEDTVIENVIVTTARCKTDKNGKYSIDFFNFPAVNRHGGGLFKALYYTS